MRISIVGPVYPYRGGIAQHTTLLARHLGESHCVQVISFTRQYPRWLTGGRKDRDPSRPHLELDALYVLDSLNPLTWWRAGQKLREWQPDVVILPWWVTFWAPAWLTLVGLARRWTSARVIFLCHNVVPHESRMIDYRVARLVLRTGDGLIVQAHDQLRVLAQLLPGKQVRYTPLPSYAEIGRAGQRDFAAAQAAARADLLLAGQKVLLYFGFVRPYKGLHVLLEAMPRIRAQQPVHLLAVGEIWEGQAQYRAQIDRLGIGDCVSVVDRYVPDEELCRYFDAADVVVLPYLSATQSAVVQLAFGFGLPVIASRVGGLPDAVEDGRTGLLVRPGDPADLAEAVLRFYAEDLGPALRARVGEAQARFSWRQMIETVEDLAVDPRCRLGAT